MNIEELIASRLEDLGEEDKRLLADLADFLAARRKGQSVDGKTDSASVPCEDEDRQKRVEAFEAFLDFGPRKWQKEPREHWHERHPG